MKTNVGIIAVALMGIIFVLLYGMGIIGPTEANVQAGSCFVPASDIDLLVSMTTGHDIADGNYDTFRSPGNGTYYQVPHSSEIRICHLLVPSYNLPGYANYHVDIGYSDVGVSNTSTIPAGWITVAHMPVQADAVALNAFATILSAIPADKYPGIHYEPGAVWTATAVGVELRLD